MALWRAHCAKPELWRAHHQDLLFSCGSGGMGHVRTRGRGGAGARREVLHNVGEDFHVALDKGVVQPCAHVRRNTRGGVKHAGGAPRKPRGSSCVLHCFFNALESLYLITFLLKERKTSLPSESSVDSSQQMTPSMRARQKPGARSRQYQGIGESRRTEAGRTGPDGRPSPPCPPPRCDSSLPRGAPHMGPSQWEYWYHFRAGDAIPGVYLSDRIRLSFSV